MSLNNLNTSSLDSSGIITNRHERPICFSESRIPDERPSLTNFDILRIHKISCRSESKLDDDDDDTFNLVSNLPMIKLKHVASVFIAPIYYS